MKHGAVRFSAIVVLSVILPEPASAEAGFFVGGGKGFSYSHSSEAVLVRFRTDTSTLLGLDSFYEGLFASWNGRYTNDAIGLARGVSLRVTEHGQASLTAGLSHMRRTTSNLGQPFEFVGRLAYDVRFGHATMSAAWLHLSDAKFLFQWPGSNNGENFFLLSLGISF